MRDFLLNLLARRQGSIVSFFVLVTSVVMVLLSLFSLYMGESNKYFVGQAIVLGILCFTFLVTLFLSSLLYGSLIRNEYIYRRRFLFFVYEVLLHLSLIGNLMKGPVEMSYMSSNYGVWVLGLCIAVAHLIGVYFNLGFEAGLTAFFVSILMESISSVATAKDPNEMKIFLTAVLYYVVIVLMAYPLVSYRVWMDMGPPPPQDAVDQDAQGRQRRSHLE